MKVMPVCFLSSYPNPENFMPTMSQIFIPATTQMLTGLGRCLDKLEAHCAAKSIDPAVFLTARLYPDMFAFTRQVQIACDFAGGAAARLAGEAVPGWPDDEVTLADVKARVQKTLAFVQALPASAMDADEGGIITLKLGRNAPEMQMPRKTYLLDVVMPNFYFHVTTAYGILRHNGVEIGKGDYLARAIPKG